ncbi:MAG: tetratricopeptide repeat protein [Planctomycetota bacterium]
MSNPSPCGPRPLPVISSAPPPAPRRSRMGWWRAGVLLTVHALIAAHIAHWLATGRTLTPLEPSEAMQLGTEGWVNAGLIFFALTLLSTAVVGRFFCGWACHLVALQDGARWLLKRVGVTPRPLRSRALAFAPLLAALYMFAWPVIQRIRAQQPFDGGLHLTTSGFWDTFPTWPVSLATFATCGFLCVYLLGSKGFCTYACPYGALFGLLDPLAPGRIRVSDACNHCGQCTSVCSSNVLVHAEVRDYGTVKDPGCMRCLDCVASCPTGALSFGFGAPGVLTRPRQDPAPRKGIGWRVELLLVVVFAAVFAAFYGLLGWVPFLFALGLAGCGAALAWVALKLLTRPSVKLGGWALKRAGARTRLGTAFLALGVPGGVLLTAYAAALQGFEARAASLHDATGAIRPGGWDDHLLRTSRGERLSAPELEQVQGALAASQRVSAWSPIDTSENLRRLAWLHLLAGDDAEAEAALSALLAAHPDAANVQWNAGNFYAAHNRPDEAEAAYRAALELAPAEAPGRYYALAQLLLSRRQLEPALEVLRQGIAHTDGHPEVGLLHHLLGELLAQTGDLEGAVAALERALDRAPEHPETLHFRLGNALCQVGRHAEGAAHYEAILELHPGDPRLHHVAGLAWVDAGEPARARPHLEAILPADGFRDPEVLKALSDVLEALGETARAAELRAEWEALRRGR